MKPLVSILIPAYNARQWLAETLQSALSQTWERKEIILVDDGSKDDTLTIARKFEWHNVKVFTQNNQGAAAARNKAFSLCQGDYIQWLDHDDLLDPEKIRSQIEAVGDCQNERFLLSGPWAKFWHRPSKARFVATALWNDLSRTEWLMRKMEQNLYMASASWLVTRQLTEAVGPWDTRLLSDDDGEYFCRVLMVSDGVKFVRRARAYWRIVGSRSLSYIGNSDRKREAEWMSMKLHIGYLRALENSERSRAACVKFLQNWMLSFYPERLDIYGEAAEIAKGLGGELLIPRLSWKYSWMRALFGWRFAKGAQRLLPNFRWTLARFWDKVLSQVDNPKPVLVPDGH